MRLFRGEDSQRSARWRIAVLPLIALFANIALPTQAALPQFSAVEWADPDGTLRSATFPSLADMKTGRWWASRRFMWQEMPGGEADPDRAILRAFPAVSAERLAAAPRKPALAGFVTDGSARAVAFAPYKADKLVWSPLMSPPVPEPRKDDPAWMRRPLSPEVYSSKEQACLATAIYFEARGESSKGQAAVAQVILNRVRNPAYPDTICGVVYQNASQHNRCQFSFACDGIPDEPAQPRFYKRAEAIAWAVTSGRMSVPEVGPATHYFAAYVRPAWAGRMVQMASIGEHRFFRTRAGHWE